MRFEAFSFGSISIDGTTYGYDVVIDRGRIRKTDSPVFLSKLGKIDHHDGSPLKHFGSSFACSATIGKTEVNRIDFCGRGRIRLGRNCLSPRMT